MQPDERDAAYLWDMLDAARTIREFTSGVGFQQYSQNRMLQLAIERAVEIIGEAARHVSEAFKQAHPEIPWRSIIAQRHVLAHQYGEIEQERIWLVATVHVAELIANLEPLIPPLPPKPEGDDT
jgi:uncharacterized protein with HEPN domain